MWLLATDERRPARTCASQCTLHPGTTTQPSAPAATSKVIHVRACGREESGEWRVEREERGERREERRK